MSLATLINTLADRWQRVPPLARSLAICAPLLIVVGLAMGTWNTVPREEWFLGGREFTQDELARLEAAWAAQELSGYQIVGGRVRLPPNRVSSFVAAAQRKEALPEDLGDELFRVSNELSPFLSASAREENLRIAKQQMLARIIRRMNDIDAAWVVLDRQPRGGLQGGHQATASVCVQSAGPRPLDRRRLGQIQQLVAASLAGLDPQAVAVVDLNSTASTPTSDSVDQALQGVLALEHLYQTRIERALAHVSGLDVVVTVSAQQPRPTEPPTPGTGEPTVMPNPGPLRLEEPAAPTPATVSTEPRPHRATALVSIPADALPADDSAQQTLAEIQHTVAMLLPSGGNQDVRIQVLPTAEPVTVATETTQAGWFDQTGHWIAIAGGVLLMLAMVLGALATAPPRDTVALAASTVSPTEEAPPTLARRAG